MISAFMLGKQLRYLYRLVKPSISEFKSIEELQYEQKQRQLDMIQEMNNQTLTHNRSFTRDKLINSLLATSHQVSGEIMKRHLSFTAVSPKSLKNYTLQQSLANGKIDYPFLLEELQPALPETNKIPMHFSYSRGVSVIPEYEWDKKSAYVFNLPDNVSTKEISEKLGLETVKNIKIEYCRLGLPAYAKVTFNSDQAVTNLVLNNKSHIEINNRVCFIKTYFDREKLDLKNRRLVIYNMEEDESQLIFQLSQYGRVTHLDYPTFITRNPSLQQVKAQYKDSSTLIKINLHKKDGSIDYEYYPSIEDSVKLTTLGTAIDLDANINEKRQKLDLLYKSRMRYAQDVHVYEGKENQVTIQNMGYCIVTYSTLEEAQNCYFNHRFSHKIKLFDSQKQEEFEIDESYRKKILRFIDSEYQKAKIIKENQPTLYSKQMDEYFSEMSLFEKLVDMESYSKIMQEKANESTEDEPEVIMSYFKTRAEEVKRNLQQKMGSKSFDELAEKQLFGRVLKKKDTDLPKINVEFVEQRKQEIQELIEGNKLQNITSKSIKDRETLYKRIKSRQTKRMGMAEQMMVEEEVEGAEGQEGEVQQQEAADEEFTGKRGFSTIKKRQVAFRQRNALETANYIINYSNYIRDVINEYQGVFSEDRLFNYNSSPTFLNPEELQFSDGTPFITEEDLSKSLECMRTFDDAQKIYSDFWKDYELFKSKSNNIYELIQNVRQNWAEGVQKYTDSGVVKEVYEVQEGEDIQKKVAWLNATVASFGDQFQSHIDQNGQQVIIKVAKFDNIYPLDRLAVVAKAKSKFDAKNTVTAKQQELFEKYKYQVLETGEIPAQVRQQFNIPENKSLDDLFEELAAEAGIYKKDIEMLLNLQNFTEEQIAKDVGLQLEMEKSRITQREARASDFAKDPSNIEVRDKEGYFKVSKFRQI